MAQQQSALFCEATDPKTPPTRLERILNQLDASEVKRVVETVEQAVSDAKTAVQTVQSTISAKTAENALLPAATKGGPRVGRGVCAECHRSQKTDNTHSKVDLKKHRALCEGECDGGPDCLVKHGALP